ncbi:hypothetical protein GCM10022222_86310 [Amycolatopsis ultiminotia]|uniref:PH domain-containing protein n=1 Tax=Amycolatopsis ultiminotia TaxID=543629 RepID=A0ABP6YV72_9PSEU
MTKAPTPDSADGPVDLPPRPDPQTGEPFPPHGLSYFGGEQRPHYADPGRETRLSHKPAPPPDKGPVLAWHRESRKGKFTSIVVGFVIMLVIVAAISLFHGDGFGAFTAWPMWIIIVVGTFLTSSPFTYLTYAAGADWLLVERSRWGIKKRIWLDLYKLTKIDASYGGTTFHLWLYNKGGGFSRSTQELQLDRRIWDLVYNGILHSVASGAQVSNQAIGILQLDKTPALKIRNSEHRER